MSAQNSPVVQPISLVKVEQMTSRKRRAEETPLIYESEMTIRGDISPLNSEQDREVRRVFGQYLETPQAKREVGLDVEASPVPFNDNEETPVEEESPEMSWGARQPMLWLRYPERYVREEEENSINVEDLRSNVDDE